MTFLPLSQKCQMHFLLSFRPLSSAKPAVSDQHSHHCHISMGNTASPSSAKVTSLPSKIPFSLHSNQNVRQGYRRLKWGQQGTLLKKVSILSWRLFFNFRAARQRQTPDQTPAVQALLLERFAIIPLKGSLPPNTRHQGASNASGNICHQSGNTFHKRGASHLRQIPAEKRFRKIASRFRY